MDSSSTFGLHISSGLINCNEINKEILKCEEQFLVHLGGIAVTFWWEVCVSSSL